MITNRLMQASTPEQVFGEIEAQSDEMLFLLQKNYRAIAKVVHPDMYHTLQEQILAKRTFTLLTDWLDKAKERIKSGEYGKKVDPSKTILRTRKREYSVDRSYVQDQMFNLYPCSFKQYGRVHQAVLKIVRDRYDNGLVENETRALRTLFRDKDAEQFSAYIPNLIDAFLYKDAGTDRQAAVFERYHGWYSLQDVHKTYPAGIDPKDMAWIWRRLLVVLGFSHAKKILHGAVLPRNIWIHPEKHGLMLVNWYSAVFDPLTTGERVQAIAPEDGGWYPQDVSIRQAPSFGT